MGNKPIAHTRFAVSRERRAHEILLQKLMPIAKTYRAAALILRLSESALSRLASGMGCGNYVASKVFDWEANQLKQGDA